MVSRGLIIQKPESIDRGFRFMFWVFYLIHRYHYPIIAVEAVISLAIGFALGNLAFSIGGMALMEVFYFSIAFHEACHMSVAKLFKVNTVSISYKPYTLAFIRTNFSRDRAIPPDDLFAIVFAGPFIPICLVAALVIILNSLRIATDVGVYVVLGIFSYVNILSLLPYKGTDGKRVYEYIKKNPAYFRTLLNSMGYCFYVKSGLENIYNKTIHK